MREFSSIWTASVDTHRRSTILPQEMPTFPPSRVRTTKDFTPEEIAEMERAYAPRTRSA